MSLASSSGLAAGSYGAHLISKVALKKRQKMTDSDLLVITGCLDI
jgi:hypothetical protein